MKVTLRFNDNKILSELYFDGTYCNNTRLKRYMLDKPFNKWIKPFHTCYEVWKGFLVELSDIFNTRNFLFLFFGTPEDFDQFQDLTKQILPANFNVKFEFNEIVAEKQTLDASFVEKIISLSRTEDFTLLRQLSKIKASIDKINVQLIYGNEYAFHSFIGLVNLPIQINSLVISMPLILITNENFADDPYEICRIQQTEPSNTMIIVQGRQSVQTQITHIRKVYKDIPSFSLTGAPKTDSLELVQMSRLYDSYKKKAFRKFILACPDENWTCPQAVKDFVATL